MPQAMVVARGLVLALSLLFAHSAAAQTRHAFVVGIDTYAELSPLQRARNDARAVAEALTQAGFQTDLLLDPGEDRLLEELTRFSAELQRGDEVAFFFAGHGVEINGRNYLLPADMPNAAPGQELRVVRRALPVSDIIEEFDIRGVRLSLLILDACRDNPFQSRGTRTLGRTRGLADEAPPEGTFILFSAGAGQSALDGLSLGDPDPNSVFTRVLVPRLTEPGLSLRDMVLQVRSEVRRLGRSVGVDQFPAVYDQLDGSFTFVPAAAPQPQPAPPTAAPCAAALPVWQTISGRADETVLTAFIAAYGESCEVLVALAQRELAALRAEPEPEPEPVPEPDEPLVFPVIDNHARPREQTEPSAPAQAQPQAAADCSNARYAIARLVRTGVRSVFENYLEDYPSCGEASAYARDRIRQLDAADPGTAGTQGSEAGLGLGDAERREVQQMLSDLGYQPGPVDGVFGPTTRTAIEIFGDDVLGTGSTFLNRTTLEELRRVHELTPSVSDGRFVLRFNRRGDPAWLRVNDPNSPEVNGASTIVGSISFRIVDGDIVDPILRDTHFVDRGTIHSLELSADGVLRFDVTVHYLVHRNDRPQRLDGALALDGRMLHGVHRPFPIGRFDDAYFADVVLSRILPLNPE